MIRSRHTDPRADEPQTPLDPAAVAELAALDAALRGESIEDDALAALVRDVQAQAPVLPPDLRKRLRHEVAEGFPRVGARRRRGGAQGRTQPGRRRSLLLGAASAASVLVVAAVVGVVVLSSPSKQGLDLSDLVEPNASVSAAPTRTAPDSRFSTEQSNTYRAPGTSSGSSSSGSAPADDAPLAGVVAAKPRALNQTARPQTGTAVTSATGTRRVERSVDMRVRVKSGGLDEAAGNVGTIVRQSGGYIADSQVSSRTRGAGSATFTLKVATSQLDRAIARLADLGTVTSQQQRSTDITSSFDSARSRLSDANAVRRALLRALDKATTAGQIASLRARIADNRRARASLDRQLASLGRRADLTTIDLRVVAPSSGAAAAIDDNGRWSLGDAVRDTGHILGAVTGGLLVTLGALLPFGVLGALAYGAYRVRRARRREAVLGA